MPVSWEAQSDIYVMPSEIVLISTGASTNPVIRYVSIRSRSGKPFKILKVESPDKSIKVIIEPQPFGYRFAISKIAPAALHAKALVLATDSSDTPQIVIPFIVIHESEP